jgi:two-component system sensor kinase FixL
MEQSTRRELTISVQIMDPDTALFAIADTGTGIDPVIAERLFEPFKTTKEDGMGIGLSICRTIIEAHGGRIWPDANDGGGTIFNFTLPFADLEDPHAR